jgi:hypothetical protein
MMSGSISDKAIQNRSVGGGGKDTNPLKGLGEKLTPADMDANGSVAHDKYLTAAAEASHGADGLQGMENLIVTARCQHSAVRAQAKGQLGHDSDLDDMAPRLGSAFSALVSPYGFHTAIREQGNGMASRRRYGNGSPPTVGVALTLQIIAHSLDPAVYVKTYGDVLGAGNRDHIGPVLYGTGIGAGKMAGSGSVAADVLSLASPHGHHGPVGAESHGVVASREEIGNPPPIVGIALVSAIVTVAADGTVGEENGVMLLPLRDPTHTVEGTVAQPVWKGLRRSLGGPAVPQSNGSVAADHRGLLP